jgi:hypothetical protein
MPDFYADPVAADLAKVGPKGYEHGWRFVGVPGTTAHAATAAQQERAQAAAMTAAHAAGKKPAVAGVPREGSISGLMHPPHHGDYSEDPGYMAELRRTNPGAFSEHPQSMRERLAQQMAGKLFADPVTERLNLALTRKGC